MGDIHSQPTFCDKRFFTLCELQSRINAKKIEGTSGYQNKIELLVKISRLIPNFDFAEFQSLLIARNELTTSTNLNFDSILLQ